MKLYLKGHNERYPVEQLQKELLQMIDDPAFQLALGVFGQLRQAKKFKDIRVFHRILCHLNLMTFGGKPIYFVLIRTECQSLIERTVTLPFEFTQTAIVFDGCKFVKVALVHIFNPHELQIV